MAQNEYAEVKTEADHVLLDQMGAPRLDPEGNTYYLHYRIMYVVRRLMAVIAEYEAEEQRIITYDLKSLPWKPHEGPPLWTPKDAIEAYRASLALRASTLVSNEMTDEQRANFAGDAKPS